MQGSFPQESIDILREIDAGWRAMENLSTKEN